MMLETWCKIMLSSTMCSRAGADVSGHSTTPRYSSIFPNQEIETESDPLKTTRINHPESWRRCSHSTCSPEAVGSVVRNPTWRSEFGLQSRSIRLTENRNDWRSSDPQIGLFVVLILFQTLFERSRVGSLLLSLNQHLCSHGSCRSSDIQEK